MGARVPDGGIKRSPELAGLVTSPSDRSLALQLHSRRNHTKKLKY